MSSGKTDSMPGVKPDATSNGNQGQRLRRSRPVRVQEPTTCMVCPHACSIRPGQLGLCGARRNDEGQIVDANFGQATALALDPIEKKPLSRFHPGSMILSYGSYGCNLSCQFCQNSDISQADACSSRAKQAKSISPEELVALAKQYEGMGNIGVALTYNEPLIAPEFANAVGKLLEDAGMYMVLATNGYANAETFDALLPLVSAANIDLKSFSNWAYGKMGAPNGLDIVCRNISAAHSFGVHIELTTLIVPGISDDEEAFIDECEWIASLDPHIPLHLSRFFPCYKMSDAQPTELALMKRFQQIACERLEHVYLGNV